MANQPRASSAFPEHGLVHDEWFENFPQNSDGFWKTAEKSETESPENEADKDNWIILVRSLRKYLNSLMPTSISA